MYTFLSMALAIFSMFFGAGNAIFPLLLGMETHDKFGGAFLGLLITAIGGPLLGLLGATLFNGRCVDFFGRMGRYPGGILIAVTLALLGPLSVLPRCVVVAHASMIQFFPSPIWLFALVFCALALFCTWKQHLLLPVLGYVLSPILITCLMLIIYQGYASDQPMIESSLSQWQAFKLGLSTGYDTMDLIASIYFSSGIWTIIALHTKGSPSEIFKMTLKSGLLGCLLLALIYLGLTYASAKLGPFLGETPPEELMMQLSNLLLGPVIGAVANIAVALACLTTVISLAMTISNIISKEIFPNKLPYHYTLLLILLITALMANIGFSSIMHIIHPVVSVCYPIIIVLTVVNILNKTYFYRQTRNVENEKILVIKNPAWFKNCPFWVTKRVGKASC